MKLSRGEQSSVIYTFIHSDFDHLVLLTHCRESVNIIVAKIKLGNQFETRFEFHNRLNGQEGKAFEQEKSDVVQQNEWRPKIIESRIRHWGINNINFNFENSNNVNMEKDLINSGMHTLIC